jgi:hypothetical protein
MTSEKPIHPHLKNKIAAFSKSRVSCLDLDAPSKHKGLNLVVGFEKLKSESLEPQIKSLHLLFSSIDSSYGLSYPPGNSQRFRLIVSTLLLHDFVVTPEVVSKIIACMQERVSLPEVSLTEIMSTWEDYVELVNARKELRAIPVAEDGSHDPNISPIAEFNLVKQLNRVRPFLELPKNYQERNKKIDDESVDYLNKIRKDFQQIKKEFWEAMACSDERRKQTRAELAILMEQMNFPKVSAEELKFKELAAKFKLKHKEKG